MDNLHSLQVPVCTVPDGNNIMVEHMPDFLYDTSFDNSSPHVHSFYEILWFKEGTGIHTIDFHEYEVNANTIFFLSPGQIHSFDHGVCYKGYSLKMCTDFMRNESSRFLKYNVFHSFDVTPCYTLNDENVDELEHIVRSIEDETCHPDALGNADVLQSLLRIFLVKILRHSLHEGTLQLSALKPSHQLFVSFRRLVEKKFNRVHTVQGYADQLNVAVRTLNKSVNECSSMSPLAFINERIILEAKRMIRYTNLMVKEIAFDLGYDDPSYFVKFFKRQTGYLPSEFRELDSVIQ